MTAASTLSSQQIKHFMQLAIDQAAGGIQAGQGGPFGACIVKAGELIACCNNTVVSDRDPTAHAEINAIRTAGRKLDRFHLTGCTLFSTCQPCPMCTGAIYWARILAVYFGCSKQIAAQAGFADTHICQEFNQPLHARSIPFTSGIMAEPCAELFKRWSTTRHRTMY